MAKSHKQIGDFFRAKKARRKTLAHTTPEEKFAMLLQLQRIASPILQSRGIIKKPWHADVQLTQREEHLVAAKDHNVLNIEVDGTGYISAIELSHYPHGGVITNYSTQDADVCINRWERLQ